ncbi:MAG: hypothetical protein JWQ72_659 [Polaromonas sp.]|nr:hypothetical protein [Polaromonas sp.]
MRERLIGFPTRPFGGGRLWHLAIIRHRPLATRSALFGEVHGETLAWGTQKKRLAVTPVQTLHARANIIIESEANQSESIHCTEGDGRTRQGLTHAWAFPSFEDIGTSDNRTPRATARPVSDEQAQPYEGE